MKLLGALLGSLGLAAATLSTTSTTSNSPSSSSSSSSPLVFTVVGDWGGLPTYPYTTPRQISVAERLGVWAARVNSQFTLALGDNFYFTGVHNGADARFQETFENVFTAESLMKPWYVIAGNHDHYGNVTGEVDYSRYSDRWNFPSLYYTFTKTTPGGETVRFVMLDTIVLCGQTADDAPAEEQPRHMDPLEGKKLADDQLQWLETTLAAAQEDWVIVTGHYPVYSIAEHGPTSYMVENVKPLLEKYNVAAYLNGHDHSMQHLNDGSVVDYFVLGAANFAESSQKHEHDVPTNSSKYMWPTSTDSQGAFGQVTLDDGTMRVDIVESTGSVLYSYTKANPRAQAQKKHGIAQK